MSIEYSAFELGLDRLVRLEKETDFVAKQALIEWQ
jgi:dimethylglycine dehydrogenase